MPTGAVAMGKDMNLGHTAPESTKYDIPAYILAGLALIGILLLHLLSALLAGLLVHQLIHIVARKLRFVGMRISVGKIAALTWITTVTTEARLLAVVGATGFLSAQS